MTFTMHCMADQLTAALAALETVTDRGLKIPILHATRLEVADGRAELIATNTDQTIRCVLAADGEGVIHLNTAALTAKARVLRQDAPVSIEADDRAATIVQKRTRWKLPAILQTDGAEFGDFAKRIDGDSVTLPFDAFVAALKAVQPAFAVDERYHLKGPHVEWVDGEMRLVATDGHLAAVVQVPGNWPDRASLLMPPEAVNAMLHLYPEGSTVALISDDKAFTLDDGDTFMRSKMIEANFPNWRRVVPTPESFVSVDAADLITALTRVSAIRPEETKSSRYVPLTMTIGDGELVLTGKNRDGEESEDVCACELDGTPFTMPMNASLLMDGLRSFGQVDTLRLGYTPSKDGSKPLTVSRVAAEGDDYRLVMPIYG